MTAGALIATLVTFAVSATPRDEPPPWRVCVTQAEVIEGVDADALADALAVEGRKRGGAVQTTFEPSPPRGPGGGCDVRISVASRAELTARGGRRVIALRALAPVDRAAELARQAGALLMSEAPDAALFDELPEPEPEPEPEVAPVPEPPPIIEPPPAAAPRGAGARASLGLAVASELERAAVFARVDVTVTAPIAGEWLIVGGRLRVDTPTTTRAGATEGQRVEVGGDALVGARWAVADDAALEVALGLGLAHRWTSAQAAEAGPVPAASVRHEELVTSLTLGLGLVWDVSEALWLGVDVTGQRYFAGTDLETAVDRLDAPRWAAGLGVRIGLRP